MDMVMHENGVRDSAGSITLSASLPLLRLFQLTSPALPIGAYAYSQGLEYAVASGHVVDEQSARQWIQGILCYGIGRADAPILLRIYAAWQTDNWRQVVYWNQLQYALRETAELQAEDHHLALALARLLKGLGLAEASRCLSHPSITFPALFSLAACRWDIPLDCSVYAYLWAWCENQVTAAVKLIPLGQTAGQRMLSALMPIISETAHCSLQMSDDQIGMALPGWIASSVQHESQYTRLFRS